MYKLKVKDKVFTIPKGNIVPFAWQQAIQRGIMRGKIHDDQTAIEYLNSIGIEVTDNDSTV